jgi:hypothetical protein
MKIYLDSGLTQEIKNLDLGILLAGEEETYKFYVYNETPAKCIKINFVIDNPEIKILEYPESLLCMQTGELIIKWSADISLKKGIKANLSLSWEELYS